MSDPKKIEVGDFVEVHVSGVEFTGTVLSPPYAERDCWSFETSDHRIVNVQRYETMWLLKKGESDLQF